MFRKSQIKNDANILILEFGICPEGITLWEIR